MPKLTQRERRHLEIAFESSSAIVKLAGLQEPEEQTGLHKRIIEGELTCAEAVQILLTQFSLAIPIKK